MVRTLRRRASRAVRVPTLELCLHHTPAAAKINIADKVPAAYRLIIDGDEGRPCIERPDQDDHCGGEGRSAAHVHFVGKVDVQGIAVHIASRVGARRAGRGAGSPQDWPK